MSKEVVSTVLLSLMAERVATLWLEGSETTHTAKGNPPGYMMKGVLPPTSDKSRETKGPFQKLLQRINKRKRFLLPRKKLYIRRKRKKGPVKKYEEKARKDPKRVKKRPGGAKSWSYYNDRKDWKADHKKRKDTSKKEYEKSDKGKKTRKDYYDKNKIKIKQKNKMKPKKGGER